MGCFWTGLIVLSHIPSTLEHCFSVHFKNNVQSFEIMS